MTHHYANKNPMTSARRDHIHGPLQIEEKRKERLTWWMLGGFATGVAVFLAFAYAAGPVGA